METLGLIAGRGLYPRELARLAHARGWRVCAVGFHGETDPALADAVDSFEVVHLGELQKLIDTLLRGGATRAVMAGKILKTHMYGDLASFHLDARAIGMLGKLADRRDDSMLGAVLEEVASEGIEFPAQTEILPELFAPEGVLGSRAPEESGWADVRFAWPIAKAMGGLDIGQSLVVKERAVVAVEAIEGTDAAIARGAELAGPGCCVVKVAKPNQDPRFDLPTIGVETVKTLAEARASVFAFEAGQTVLLEPEEVAASADAAGIALVCVASEGPPGFEGPPEVAP